MIEQNQRFTMYYHNFNIIVVKINGKLRTFNYNPNIILRTKHFYHRNFLLTTL